MQHTADAPLIQSLVEKLFLIGKQFQFERYYYIRAHAPLNPPSWFDADGTILYGLKVNEPGFSWEEMVTEMHRFYHDETPGGHPRKRLLDAIVSREYQLNSDQVSSEVQLDPSNAVDWEEVKQSRKSRADRVFVDLFEYREKTLFATASNGFSDWTLAEFIKLNRKKRDQLQYHLLGKRGEQGHRSGEKKTTERYLTLADQADKIPASIMSSLRRKQRGAPITEARRIQMVLFGWCEDITWDDLGLLNVVRWDPSIIQLPPLNPNGVWDYYQKLQDYGSGKLTLPTQAGQADPWRDHNTVVRSVFVPSTLERSRDRRA